MTISERLLAAAAKLAQQSIATRERESRIVMAEGAAAIRAALALSRTATEQADLGKQKRLKFNLVTGD